MAVCSLRVFLLCAFLAITASTAVAQTAERPPVGGFGSPPDAMIFYVAHGAENACGAGCSDWIAAEGTVQWDTYKRLINILDRQQGRKLPLAIHVRGRSNLKVSTSLGRILRERGLDTMEGATIVAACGDKSEADCFALKRPGGPLEAVLNPNNATCDIGCVLILAGGVHRSLHAATRVILTGMEINNRLGLNVSDEHRTGVTLASDHDFRLYLRDMGVDTELMDIVDQNSAKRSATELTPADWTRLHLVTSAPQ